MTERQRTVLVTGAAGGLGAAAVRLLADRGWRVFAADVPDAVLAEGGGAPGGVVPVRLDVTDPTSVAAAREQVTARCDGLDGVVHFAGIIVVGALIEMDERTLARVLDVNVLGTHRVDRAFFPLVRARSGRLVHVSSEVGWQTPMPFVGAYAASKHAIEAYSDALRRELVFLGVRVVKIQPGPFRTQMVTGIEERFAAAAQRSELFGELIRRLVHLTAREQAGAADPGVLAEVVLEALTVRRPRAAYSVRPDRLRSAMSRLPTRVVDEAIERGLRFVASRRAP